MINFANNNYHSGKKANNGAAKRGFLITVFFILSGLSLVIADHAGHNLQAQRAMTSLK
ncbi:hypothetical protein AWB81_04262 [Caballeronia arationis]|uniref:hypothetical protein n=1 Tax=Caballeronia arationis TaxID=1777142 RepID=UPI00074B817D|nr:hypothetical protein [Caballeronia arationis]SAK84048.1 hypothetical protein AWB81_04262 [Caballeronia arationis]